jgi:hypothetical protein
VSAPYAYRVLAGEQAVDELRREIVCACGVFPEIGFAPLGNLQSHGIFGVFEPRKQRLVFSAAKRHGIAHL